MRTWSKTNNLSGWAWRQASKQASRQPRGEASLDGWNWSKCTWMSIFLNRFHLHWKGRCNFTLYMGQCSFLLTVLAFRCPLSVYSQIDIGCGIKIVAVFVSAKNTLSRHQPTNPPTQIQEVCQRHLSKTNSHLHQMQATKTISPRRQESRNSAAPNERQQDIQQPKTWVFGDKPASSWPRKQDPKN